MLKVLLSTTCTFIFVVCAVLFAQWAFDLQGNAKEASSVIGTVLSIIASIIVAIVSFLEG